jgi:Glycosyl transferase family 2
VFFVRIHATALEGLLLKTGDAQIAELRSWPLGMTDQARVSWLLPVRDGMPYVRLTLESIRNQTYRNHYLIAWDNGSTDGTLELLHEWVPGRIPGVVISGKPLRLGPTLAEAVRIAETELCAVMHADDINHPWRLERQVSFLERNPAVGVLGGQSDFIDENGAPIPGWTFPCDDATLRWQARWSPAFMHANVMFRRSVILEAGNYRDLQPFEDTELWMRAAGITEFANLPDSLIQYRRSSQSQTGQTVDFKPIFREAAKASAGIIFPGVPAEETMSFWEATYPHHFPGDWPRSAPFRYRRYLHRTAVLLARRCRKPDNYFSNTALFDVQKYHLQRMWMESHGLSALRRARVWLAGQSQRAE